MKPIGKTYLIEVTKKKTEDKIDGIYIPITEDSLDAFYKGKIVEYGTSWTNDEIKNLIPIGTEVYFNYKVKKGIKIIIGEKIYYIHSEEEIFAMTNED